MYQKAMMILTLGMCLLQSVGSEEKAQELVNCEDPSDWEGMVKVNTEIKRSGQISFELYGKYPTEIISSRMIPIDMNKTYNLSAYLRTLDKQFPASAFMGLRMYDKNKKPITIQNVGVCLGTETTLAADAVRGAKELRIVTNAAWLKQQNAVIVFNAGAEYEDLPNFDISPEIEKTINEGETDRVILKGSLGKAYPSGTKVRLHAPWAAPLYGVAHGWMPTEWREFSATFSGEAQSGTPGHQFWRGTKYVRVFVWFGNYDKIPKEGARLLVDDITFTCGERNFMALRALQATFRNPKLEQEHNQQWSFQTDARDEGLAAGWMKTDWNDKTWPLIDADRWWQEQGYPSYHGVAWYRKSFAPPAVEKGSRLFLYFGAVDGDASVFLNGRKIGEHNLLADGTGWDQPFFFDITDFLVTGNPNVMAVRAKKTAYMSGIFKGVRIISTDAVARGE